MPALPQYYQQPTASDPCTDPKYHPISRVLDRKCSSGNIFDQIFVIPGLMALVGGSEGGSISVFYKLKKRGAERERLRLEHEEYMQEIRAEEKDAARREKARREEARREDAHCFHEVASTWVRLWWYLSFNESKKPIAWGLVPRMEMRNPSVVIPLSLLH